MRPQDLSSEPVELVVAPDEEGWRLDVFLAHHFSQYSRVHLRRAITAGGATINAQGGKPSYRLHAGQGVDDLAGNTPRGASAGEHPSRHSLRGRLAGRGQQAAGNGGPSRARALVGTLAGALAHHLGNRLSTLGGPARPGIVHRLDRDTSGVILVAKNDQAHGHLATQFERRTIEKEYFALVAGAPEHDRDLIDRRIGIHPQQREKMAIRRDEANSRAAVTFYEVAERFDGFAAMRLLPKTGRTHQIRVHLGHVGCPVLCDRQYGGRAEITRGEIRRDASDTLVLLNRQALHARRLKFTHPATDQRLEIEAPLPADLLAVLAELRAYRASK